MANRDCPVSINSGDTRMAYGESALASSRLKICIDQRVQQSLEPVALIGIREYERAQLRPIECTVGLNDLGAEVLADRLRAPVGPV